MTSNSWTLRDVSRLWQDAVGYVGCSSWIRQTQIYTLRTNGSENPTVRHIIRGLFQQAVWIQRTLEEFENSEDAQESGKVIHYSINMCISNAPGVVIDQGVPWTIDGVQMLDPEAPEFYPDAKWSIRIQTTSETSGGPSTKTSPREEANDPMTVCSYSRESGLCEIPHCTRLHPILCILCNTFVLHPSNEQQRNAHRDECVERIRQTSMELKQKSQSEMCAICLDTMSEKCAADQIFGILPTCNHCFCLSCITKWMETPPADIFHTEQGCPVCRISPPFICPSVYWMETKEDKEKLMKDYSDMLGLMELP